MITGVPTPLIQESASSLWCLGFLSLVQLIDLRSRALLIKVVGSLDLQLVPSHTQTRSPTLGLVLPSRDSRLHLDSSLASFFSTRALAGLSPAQPM